MQWTITFVALAVLGVAAVSRRLAGTPVTPAMVFIAVGVVLGPKVLGEIVPGAEGEIVRTLAEATLAVLLFCDASRIDLATLRREAGVPARLLGIGLPLTIILGALAAALFGNMTVGEALVLSVILAPTDAALGQAVVAEPRLPSRIRQGLNVESGLNDGICVPLLFIVLAAADVESHVSTSHTAIRIVLEEIGYGLLGGIGAGLSTAAVVAIAGGRKLIAESWMPLIPLMGAVLAYSVASALGGSGFIAAFVAGALFGELVKRDVEPITHFTEQTGELLNGITFLVFGAVLLGPALSEITWRVVVYSLISLTIARMVPVAISLIGTGARTATAGFLGWFGPRGLASIVFALIVVQESHLPQAPTIVATTYFTVGLSALVHGVSAAPLADRYVKWFEAHPDRPAMERKHVRSLRVRGSRAAPAPEPGE